MPIRGSPNGAGYLRPQAGRDRPESVVAINRNGWSQSIGMAGRNRPVRAQRPSPAGLALNELTTAVDSPTNNCVSVMIRQINKEWAEQVSKIGSTNLERQPEVSAAHPG